MGVILSPLEAMQMISNHPELKSPYPSTYRPKFHTEITKNGNTLIRFDSVKEMSYWDYPESVALSGVESVSIRSATSSNTRKYLQQKYLFTDYKRSIYEEAMREIELDKEFKELVRKANSSRKKRFKNLEDGDLNIDAFVEDEDKCWDLRRPQRHNNVLDIAFQVGTFIGGNYKEGIIKIVKTIHMCNALRIALNIDVFDSDTRGVDNSGAYIISNIAKANSKPDLGTLMSIGEPEFFRYTLFNGYSQVGKQHQIGTFLSTNTIVDDLKDKYDVIGGNLLSNDKSEMVSQVLKIAKICC